MGIFPMPPTIHSVVENWKKDYEFCRQFLQGVNPFLIKIVGDIAEVPQDMRELVAKEAGQSFSVHELIDARRLLMVDYAALANVTLATDDGYYKSSDDRSKSIFYAPYVLMFRSNEPTKPTAHNLKPLGIQLTRLACDNKVYTPDSS